MLFKEPKVFTYYRTQLESSRQVYTAALTSFYSSSFFRTLPATACVSLICLPPKDRDPAFLDGWSSATFSTVPGINALVEAEDTEVSLLRMFVDSENFRGSSEGGLGGLGLAVQSGHPHSQSLWVLEFLYMQPKAPLEAKSEMSTTCFWLSTFRAHRRVALPSPLRLSGAI